MSYDALKKLYQLVNTAKPVIALIFTIALDLQRVNLDFANALWDMHQV
jgi:hypothetical protein